TKKEIHAMLVGYLAGRAAEELVFDTVTTGAANDIEQATQMARAMVTQYGMSDKFGLMGLATQENQYLTGRTVMNCGDETAAEVDREVMRILKEAYEEAKTLLSENRDVMDKIAEFLIEKETITGKEFMKIFREMKGIPEPEEKSDDQSMPAQTAEPNAQDAEPNTQEAEPNTQEAEPDAQEAEPDAQEAETDLVSAVEEVPAVAVTQQE
ncbi:MAG: AAA family ATPase, partial [Hungatella sp.]